MGDSKVECQTCRKSKRVRFATCLRSGWPMCCGSTMRLLDHPNLREIREATKKVVSGQVPRPLVR